MYSRRRIAIGQTGGKVVTYFALARLSDHTAVQILVAGYSANHEHDEAKETP